MITRAKRSGVLALSSILMIVPFLVITYYDDLSKEGIRRMVRVENEKITTREEVVDGNTNKQIIPPFHEICPEDYPPQHAMLHDDRSDMIGEYETFWKGETGHWNEGDDVPEIFSGENHYFAVWTPETWYETEASVWNATAQALQSNNITEDDYVHNHEAYIVGYKAGWVDPKTHIKDGEDIVVKEVLEGDWVGFSSWWIGNFGHFVHDHLPTIAFLRSSVPETTKFLLVDSKISRNIIKAVDAEFYENRVKWINQDDIYRVTGKLHVAIRRNHHISIGCCAAFDPMRQWIADVKPDVPEKRTVVFYSRGGSKDTHHGRVLQHEDQVLHHVKDKMKQHNLQEELVIFNGRDEVSGNTLDVIKQAEIFRSAKTIIGPHGSGLGGNFIWTYPYPKTCGERTQLLEFMPGTDALEVQHGPWVSYYNTIRKWPLDYHNILYTSESNFKKTYINLNDLDKALDYMWGGGSPALNSVPK